MELCIFSPPLFSHPPSFFSPPCPFPFFPSLLLEIGPINPARGSGGAVWTPPAGSGSEPQLKYYLVYLSLIIWPLVATIVTFFWKINKSKNTNTLLWWLNGIARWWNDNFRWWNARHRLQNAVPAEFNCCSSSWKFSQKSDPFPCYS